MKKQTIVTIFVFLLLGINNVKAQLDIDSLGFNYSALVRDSIGRPMPLRNVTLEFTLTTRNGDPSQPSFDYQEEKTFKTDNFGFANHIIGTGVATSKSSIKNYYNVDFSKQSYWLWVRLKTSFNATGWEVLAKQRLEAVPYAKVAGKLAGESAIPSGTIVAFAGDVNKIPKGWMLCDGKEVDGSVDSLKALFNVISYNWGKPNNVNPNIFNLPDLRGLFLRGVDLGSGKDPNANGRNPIKTGGIGTADKVGSYQDDAFQGHRHNVQTNFSRGGQPDNASSGNNRNGFYSGFINILDPISDGTNGNPRTTSETRPKNAYVNYIIKL
jgi:microcystin-dependent protein